MISKSEFDFDIEDIAGNHIQISRSNYGLILSTAAMRYSGIVVLIDWEDLKALHEYIGGYIG